MFYLFHKAGCATFFWPGAVSERNGHFFYSVMAVPRSAVPFTLKAAEFSVSALQLRQHCTTLSPAGVLHTVFFCSRT